jgi:hypothetical protein
MTQLAGHITPGNSAGYTVRSGDTLSGIAQRAYDNGSEAYWMALYVANQDTIGSNPIATVYNLHCANLRRSTNSNPTPKSTHTARINGIRFSGGGAGAITRKTKMVRINSVPSTGTTP